MNSADAGRALIFAWDKVRHVPLVLPGFFLLALVAHIAAFFTFRVVYPSQATLRAPPPGITVLDPTRPDHQALLRWAEAEDAVPIIAQTGITERLLEVSYRPSFSTARTAPLTLPPEPERVQYPPPRDPVSFIRSVEPKASLPPAPAKAGPTHVILGGDLAPRLRGNGTLKVTGKSTTPIEPAQFLIGVTGEGEVRFVIVQRSSGDDALDADVADQLSRLQLSPASSSIVWGMATIHWGADAYAGTAASAPGTSSQ